MKPHKWAKEIKAWADGADIEHRWHGNIYVWHKCTKPIDWENELIEYRIKPQPKEPQYLYVYYDKNGIIHRGYKAKNPHETYIGKIKLETEND